MKEEIKTQVKVIVAKQLGLNIDQIKDDSNFVELGADSLDSVELILDFGEKFNIEIPDEDAEKIKTVKDAINYLKTITKEKNE